MTSQVHPGLTGRLREIRVDAYGEGGLDALAGELGMTPGAWLAAESGGEVGAVPMLLFARATGVGPRRMLTGAGPRSRLDRGRPLTTAGTAHMIRPVRRGSA